MYNPEEHAESAARCHRLYEKSWTALLKTRQVLSTAGPMAQRTGLDIGGLGGALGLHLQEAGGTWSHLDLTEPAAQTLAEITGQPAEYLTDGQLPYEEAAFDLIVITDRLHAVQDKATFIAECHRVLKAGGRLLVLTDHRKPGSLLYPIKKLLRLTDPREAHPGYTQQELYHLLKDGFDVHAASTALRFGAAFWDAVCRRTAGLTGPGEAWEREMPEQEFGRVYRGYCFWYPLIRLAALLDNLLFLSKGHLLLVDARRRIWKPRATPKLRDGRSIADATINTKIGTAAPF